MRKITSWISTKYHQYLRVWRLLKKPSFQEFKLISKVTAVGLLIIGAIGFAISLAMKFVV